MCTRGLCYMLKKTEGIVMKTRAYGETHKLLTVFTKEFGKLTAISRGANKPKSRLNAVSQLFVQGEFLIYIGKGLGTVQQGQVLMTHRNIQENIDKTAYVAYIIELTDKILEDRKPDLYLYQQLSKTLAWINDAEDYMVPVMMYEMKLYKKGGFAPVIDHCVNCENESNTYTFSIQEGGLLCPSCSHFDRHAITLQPSLIRLLNIFYHVGLERIGNIHIKGENEQLLRKVFDHYYDQYGGFSLKSKKFLKQLNKFT